jgi:hypothetical protein
MTAASAIPEEARRELDRLGQADLVIGIPSYNNASTIGYVVEMAIKGLTTYFPGRRAVVVDSDGGSSDDTTAICRGAACPVNLAKVAFKYVGLPGKGSALRGVFEAADRLGALACLVLDSDLRSVAPEWVDLLAGPIVRDGYGYVTPYYSRYKYDGTITNNIAYPLTRALYGVDVRQPIGGDFGMSGALIRSYLQKDVWESDVARFGIDIWMTTTAINEGFKIAQARLGAKIHDAKDPAASLGPMFAQVVGTLFRLMTPYQANWLNSTDVRPTAFFGPAEEAEPEPVEVSLAAMIDKFKDGASRLAGEWARVLAPDTLERVSKATGRSYEEYRFPAEDWIRVVYDFAIAASERPGEMSELIGQLSPLYYGRTAGFVVETKEMTMREAEGVIQAQAKAYLADKGYLVQRWKSRRAAESA